MNGTTIVHTQNTQQYSSAIETINPEYGFGVNRFIVRAMETARRLNEKEAKLKN